MSFLKETADKKEEVILSPTESDMEVMVQNDLEQKAQARANALREAKLNAKQKGSLDKSKTKDIPDWMKGSQDSSVRSDLDRDGAGGKRSKDSSIFLNSLAAKKRRKGDGDDDLRSDVSFADDLEGSEGGPGQGRNPNCKRCKEAAPVIDPFSFDNQIPYILARIEKNLATKPHLPNCKLEKVNTEHVNVYLERLNIIALLRLMMDALVSHQPSQPIHFLHQMAKDMSAQYQHLHSAPLTDCPKYTIGNINKAIKAKK